jgi:TP901-1 family phage major tail protein
MPNPPAAGANCWRAPASAVAGRGLFTDSGSDALLREAFFAGTTPVFEIVIPDFGTLTGPFQITSLEFAGEHNGELTFDVALESAGALAFAAL